MSYQPTQLMQGHMPTEAQNSTYTCPYCHADILESNKDTHEARCARMNRNQPQAPSQQSQEPQRQERIEIRNQYGRQEQGGLGGLKITREHSSSSLPYPEEVPDSMRQAQINRDARRVADNKLVTCGNCEKSVREQYLADHQANDCVASDRIPCEFCNKPIPMNFYTHHIDDCPKRLEEENQQQQQRARSLERQDSDLQRQQQQYAQQRQQQQEPQRRVQSAERVPPQTQNRQQMQEQNQRQERPASQEREPQAGGFMGFLKNLATLALQGRSDVEDSEEQIQPRNQPQTQQRQQSQPQPQRQQQQQQQAPNTQSQGQQPGFISRLLGLHPETPEEAAQRRALRAERYEREQQERRRREEERRQRERQMLENLFEPRNDPFMGLRQQQQQQQQQQQGQYPGSNVRTIRLGPNGSIMMSYGHGNNQGQRRQGQDPFAGLQPRQRASMQHNMAEMGPLGILLSMMNGELPGMRTVTAEELENMTQEEQAGLAREVLDSLSVVKYEKSKNQNVSEDLKSCPICIEDFEDGDEVRYLWCMHRFHKKCVDQWLDKHTNCPICKKEFSENDVSYDA